MTFVKKKSLAQNFLKSVVALNKIVDSAKINAGETVLEIGPGEGTLTEKLLETGARVLAVEKDRRLIPVLQKKFSTEISSGKLILIHSDILDFSPSNFNLTANSYKLIANIPYYITGEIFRKALSEWPQPSRIVLLVQKEVAERIVARDGKESLLSISVKIYGEPKIAGIVKAGSFVPAPKVDSAILVIENISKGNFFKVRPWNPSRSNLEETEKRFFDIVRAGFTHKRKKLAGNLKPIFGEYSENRLTTCGLEKNIRAENLTVENWLCLSA